MFSDVSVRAHSVVDPVGDRSAQDPLVVILGPTASGKSELALEIARRFEGEILSCDSVQVYGGFDIGSAKVLPHERGGLPHHLIDIAGPDELFTAGDYRRAASQVLAGVRDRGRVPIVVGGSGLYLRALLTGLFDGPARSEALRARLKTIVERHGCGFLHRLLNRLDPKTAARVHANDVPKVIRALEVCLLARQPMSDMLARGRPALSGFHAIKIGLNPDRAALYERINRRVERMYAAGLLDEVRALLACPNADRFRALGALGYRQACAAVRGDLSAEEAIQATQLATRRFAKRQMTWFRREPEVTWFAGFGDELGIQVQVLDWVSKLFRATAPVERASAPAGGESRFCSPEGFL
jgi:tRNA dimethylallyltransferase